MNEIIHQDKNMTVFYKGNELYVEHKNHDNSCYLYTTNDEVTGFNGTLDLCPDITNWINNHKKYFFGDELDLYQEQEKEIDDYVDALIKEHEEEENERARQDALHDIQREEE